MTLDPQRAELLQLGYSMVSESDTELVAVRPKWYWDLMFTSLTSVLFVRSVANLTGSVLQADCDEMLAGAAKLDPSRWPTWLQHGRAAIAVYIADSISQEAQRVCESAQPTGFGELFYPAALERSSGRAFYLRKTPFWGWMYHPILRYQVQRLIDPSAAPAREPRWLARAVTLAFLMLVAIPVVSICWLMALA